MTQPQGYEAKSATESAAVVPSSSPFVSSGGELPLSNLGQLELLRGVLERGVPLRMSVRGFSMAPFVRDQDVLTIASMNGHEPRVGEVIAFTLADTGRLTIHRVIARVGAGWLLRGDNCPEADGVVSGEAFVGRVVRVERGGRAVRLGLGPEGALFAVLNRGNAVTRLHTLWHLPHRAAAFTLRRAQGLAWYRAVGRRVAPLIDILEANDADLATVHRHLNPFELYRRQPASPHATNWVAKRGAKVIGFVQLVYSPEALRPGHWLSSLTVWGRYRGLGVGEALMRRVIERAQAQGAAELLLAVFEENKRAINLNRKLGFTRSMMPVAQPDFPGDKPQTERRLIVMQLEMPAQAHRTEP